MMKRGKINFVVSWFRLDTGHVDYAAALAALQAQHEGAGSFTFSTNMKKDSAESLVKVAGVGKMWHTGKSWENAVLTSYDDTDHGSAVALVKVAAWGDTSLP